MPTVRARLESNPFRVLAIPVTAERADVERAAQLLLAKLELGLTEALSYDTPFGSRERTPELVRKAAAELRDPDRRVEHEFWALGDVVVPDDDADPSRPPEHDVMARLGWRARSP